MRILDSSRGEDETSLHKVAEDKPCAATRPNEVSKLASNVSRKKEESKGNSDVGRLEDVAIQIGEDEGQNEEDRVAGLVRGEAVEVRERNSI